MIILLALPTVMADPLEIAFTGQCEDSKCNLDELFSWAETEHDVKNIDMITVDVSDFEGLTVTGFGATGDRIQYGPTTLEELYADGYSTIQFQVGADIDIDGWNGDLGSIDSATYSALPSVKVYLDLEESEITSAGWFYSLAPEGYIPATTVYSNIESSFQAPSEDELVEISENIAGFFADYDCDSPELCAETPLPFGIAMSQLCVYDSLTEIVGYVDILRQLEDPSTPSILDSITISELMAQLKPIRDAFDEASDDASSDLPGHVMVNLDVGTLHVAGQNPQLSVGMHVGLFTEKPDLGVGTYGMSLDNSGKIMCGVLGDIIVDDSNEPWYLVFFEYEKCGEDPVGLGSLPYEYDGTPCEESDIADDETSMQDEFGCTDLSTCFEKSGYGDCYDGLPNSIDLSVHDGSVITKGDIDQPLDKVPKTWSFGYYSNLPLLPVDAYGVSLNADGTAIGCGYLGEDLVEGDMYLLLHDFTGYSCDGELTVGPKEYDFSGSSECVKELGPGYYDTDRDSAYTLSDTFTYLQWSLAHKVNGFTTIRYPLDAAVLDRS